MKSETMQKLRDRRRLRPAAPSSNKARLWACVAAATLVMLEPVTADATDFSGAYALSNWTTSNFVSGGDGYVEPLSSDSINLWGNTTGGGGFLYFTIHAAAPGNWSFGYDYFPALDGSYGQVGYVLSYDGNITPNTLNESTDGSFGGSKSFDIDPLLYGANTTIGFYIYTSQASSLNDVAYFNITNFNAPTQATPEPSSLWLLAAGSLAMARKRRKL